MSRNDLFSSQDPESTLLPPLGQTASGSQLVDWVDGKTEILTAEKSAMSAADAIPSGGVLAAWDENGGASVQLVH